VTEEPGHPHLRETTVDRRVVHRGRYLTFRQDTILDADGREHTRDIVDHPGAVAVVAIDDDDRLLMVRQWRSPIGSALLEIPAGTLDRLDGGATESPELAAPRELGEETGLLAATWRKLGTFWTAPGFATEEMHLYLAEGLTSVEGYAGPEADERLDVERVPWAEAVRMCLQGGINDAKTIVGVLWVDRLRTGGSLEGSAAGREGSRASASRYRRESGARATASRRWVRASRRRPSCLSAWPSPKWPYAAEGSMTSSSSNTRAASPCWPLL
jgi:ADP-ribose pyrophosphatase